jgi:hypothetical protein
MVVSMVTPSTVLRRLGMDARSYEPGSHHRFAPRRRPGFGLGAEAVARSQRSIGIRANRELVATAAMAGGEVAATSVRD